MKKILIVSLFGDLISGNNSRLYNIYNYAVARKTIVTTDFNHGNKVYKEKNLFHDIVYLHVPAYKKNISIKRIYSHLCFALNLRDYLNNISDKPDVIYCSMPTSSAAYVCGKFCKKNNIKFVVDVIDLWPDSLIPLNRVYKLLSPFLYFWKRLTISAYRKADVILGESKKYAEIAQHYNPNAQVYPLYLGVDLEQIKYLKAQSDVNIIKPENEIWICYGGSLGNSYDFDTLLNAVSEIHGICNYKLLFVGGGEKRMYIQNKINELSLNATITGQLSYADYLKYLSFCDIAINIFKENTLVVHSYKFNDYVASGLFILNSLKGETAEVIEKYNIGKNFDFSEQALSVVLKDVCVNWETYRISKSNNIRLIDELMDKKKIYNDVLSKVL